MVDDVATMARSFKSLENFAKTRSARFQLHPQPSDLPFDEIWREEGSIDLINYMDELMYQVPGMSHPQILFSGKSNGLNGWTLPFHKKIRRIFPPN